jgi:hypothetical protein
MASEHAEIQYLGILFDIREFSDAKYTQNHCRIPSYLRV